MAFRARFINLNQQQATSSSDICWNSLRNGFAIIVNSNPERNFRYSVAVAVFSCVCLFTSCFLEYCRTQLLLMLIKADSCAAGGGAVNATTATISVPFYSKCSKCHTVRPSHTLSVHTFFSPIRADAFLPSRCKCAMVRESTNTLDLVEGKKWSRVTLSFWKCVLVLVLFLSFFPVNCAKNWSCKVLIDSG